VLLPISAGRSLLTVGLAMGATVGALCFVLAALIALPLLVAVLPAGPSGRGRPALLSVLAVALTVALVGAGLAVDRFDARHPQPTSLLYVLDADTGSARWLGTDDAPAEWVRRHAPDPVAADAVPPPLPYAALPRWTGPAPSAALPAPELVVLGTRPDGDATVVELRLRSVRDAEVLTLHTDRPVEQATVQVDGLPPGTSWPTYDDPGHRWPFRLQFYDPPEAGVTVQLRMADAAGLKLTVADHNTQLAGLPGFEPRPAELTRSPAHHSDLAVVTRSYQL
jgi:hypothetical protein